MATVSMATNIGKDNIKLRIPVSPLRKPCMVANYFNIICGHCIWGYMYVVLTKLAPDDLKHNFTNGAWWRS